MENFKNETVQGNMACPARTVAPEMTLGDLLRLFASDDFEIYPVVRAGKLVGLVSRADSIRPFADKSGADALHLDEIMGTTVEQIMSPPATTLTSDARLGQAIQLMVVNNCESIPVVDCENRVKGIIAREDVIRALARSAWRSSLPLPLPPMGYAIA